MRLIKYISTFVLIGATQAAPASSTDCYRAVQKKSYAKIVNACVELPNHDRLATMNALATGDFTHHLGTADEPSPALTLLRAYADAGEVNAQYTYGLLTSMVHVQSVERWEADNPGVEAADIKALNQHNDRIRDEASGWMMLAADQGHTLAMLEAAEYLVRKSYRDPETDLGVALGYAQKAKEQKSRLAEHMIERVQKRMQEMGY